MIKSFGKYFRNGCALFSVVFALMVVSSAALAQNATDGANDAEQVDIIQNLYKTLDHQNNLKEIGMTPEYIRTIPTLFFTKWQHALLVETRRGARPGAVKGSLDDEGQVVKGPREISLSGIVYKSKDKWTIWLNNKRIAPNAIPEEVMDLNVYSEHIELEWFDAYTNKIYPIRLRPHQRFNLDSRIFLPGAGVAN